MRFLIYYALFIALFGLTSCSGESNNEQAGHGTVTFALTSPQGHRFEGGIRLDARFAGGTDISLYTTADDGKTALSTSAMSGFYLIHPLWPWTLYDENDVDVTDDITSYAFSPGSLFVTNGTTHNVTLTIFAGEDAIDFTFGGVAFDVVVDEAACTPGCGLDESCIAQNNAEAYCAADCGNSSECEAGEACYSGSCVIIPAAP